jgi:hypothetical protein
MDYFIELLKIILPATLVAFTSYLIIKKFLEREASKQLLEIKLNNQKLVTPIKLQAIERIVLLLERISLTSLTMRVYKQGMNCGTLQSELLKNIRAEFDHNISQQVYVSSNAWDAVKTAKEETIKAVNIAATKVSNDANATQLCTIIYELITKVEKMPTEVAIEIIKLEARQIL